MPKEVIYSDQPEFIANDDGSHGTPGWVGDDPRDGDARRRAPVQRHVAVVGWSPDQFVEVGIDTTRNGSRDPGSGGQYATFDRQGINRLIRTLRKARDAAYGSDA